MSIKGHEFTAEECEYMPPGLASKSEEQREAWATEQTERWKIVAYCQNSECREDRQALVAGEVEQHALNHLPDWARPIAGMLVALTPERRHELLAEFPGGDLDTKTAAAG